MLYCVHRKRYYERYTAMITLTCPRCNGTGHYSYHPSYGTVCFKCNGAGTIEYTEAQYKAMQKRANKAAEIKELRQEEMKAKAAISAQVVDALIARYVDSKEFQRRIAHSPDSKPLQMEVALLLFCREKGIKRYNWIGELAQYL